MALEGFKPNPLDVFGGLWTRGDRASVRPGLSPDCRNVRFAPGMVATRDGYDPVLADSSQPFYGVSQLVRANGDRHLVVISDNGRMKAEFPGGTLTTLEEGVAYKPVMKAAELFSTQYMCFSDGRFGKAPMRRYDGANLGPVGVGAPGVAPTLAESAVAATGAGLDDGVHSAIVVFVNKWGDISGWSPVSAPVTFAGGATKKTSVTVPLGPPDTAQRVVGITPKDSSGPFRYTSKLIVSDNTTATAIDFDISEAELIASQNSLDPYVSNFVPWMPLGCASYQERLIVWGARATLQPLVDYDTVATTKALSNYGLFNLAFDGGFASTTPNGWTAVGSGQAVGGAGTILDGRCLRITGDAVSASRGEVSQEAPNKADYLSATGRYGISVLARSSSLAAGTLYVELAHGTSGGPWTVLLTAAIPLPLTPDGCWRLTDTEMGVLAGSQYPDVRVRAWVGDGPMGASQWVDFQIALYDANDTQYQHTLVVSNSGRPGTFSNDTGVASIGPDDGEGIRNIFEIRETLFIAKERSLHSIENATSGDVTTWGASLVSPYGGTPSVHGIAKANGYIASAGRDGLYLFDGGIPRLASRSIEPTWRGMDWSRAERLILILDPTQEIVRVAMPSASLNVNLDGCDSMLVCDFKDGWGDGNADGGGAKWSLDTFQGNARILAGMVALNGLGVHAPVFSVVGEQVQNEVADSSDFSTYWAFPGGSPTATTGQADGRSGNYATKWAWGAFPKTATHPMATNLTGRPKVTVSLRVKSDAAFQITVALSGSGPTHTQDIPANLWTRVVARFQSDPGDTETITFTFGAGALTYVTVADFQIAFHTKMADWGFSDTAAGSTGFNYCALLVTPLQSVRRDFAGEISTLYETGMFGERVGRSRFDRCLVRAVGNGYVAAKYRGLGSREWAMTSVQATGTADEDLEFGADLIAPMASLVISTTSEDGWMSVRGLTVFSSPLGVGGVRGRN